MNHYFHFSLFFSPYSEKWTDCMIWLLFKNTERKTLCCHTKMKQFCVSKQFEAHTQTLRVCLFGSVKGRATMCLYMWYICFSRRKSLSILVCVCVQTRLHKKKSHIIQHTHWNLWISNRSISINKKKGTRK